MQEGDPILDSVGVAALAVVGLEMLLDAVEEGADAVCLPDDRVAERSVCTADIAVVRGDVGAPRDLRDVLGVIHPVRPV